jgi:hypothetical protein
LVIFVQSQKTAPLMRLYALIIFIFFALVSNAQQPSSADLEKRKQSILESIRQTEQLLEATKKDKNATMGQLRALQSVKNLLMLLMRRLTRSIAISNLQPTRYLLSNKTWGRLKLDMLSLYVMHTAAGVLMICSPFYSHHVISMKHCVG